jgi:TolB-like protein
VVYVAARFPARRVAFGLAAELATAVAQLPGALGVSPAAAAALVALNPLLSIRFAVQADPARDQEALRRRALALLDLITAVSEEAPFALLCDDLQWADPASADTLAWLLGNLGTARVVCVTAATSAFEGPAHAPVSEQLELAPLSEVTVRTLVTSLAPLPEVEWARHLPEWLHGASGGSPRLLLERLDETLEQGLLTLGPTGWTCADPDALARHLAAPPAARPVLLLVVPFISHGATGADDHLADGLTEGLIADLSRVPGLRVVALASAMRLRGGAGLRQGAAAVGARYVLEGALHPTADRIEVAGRLCDAASGAVVREELCAGSRRDLLAVRERLAQAVVEALRLPPSSKEGRRLRGRAVEDMHAYECYWHARQCILRFRPDELERALEILRHGLERGGDNALLYATMGMVYWNLVNAGVNPDEGLLVKAEEYVDKVFGLEPDAPYGHVLAGHIALARSRPRDAVEHYRRALALDPNNADALAWLAFMYVQAGKLFAARALAHRLLEIDPLTPVNNVLPGFVAMCEGRFEEALPAYRRAYELDRNPPGHITLAVALARAGHVDEACDVLRSLNQRAPGTLTAQYGMFLEHALRGERSEALTALTPHLERYVRFQSYLAWHMGAGHALIGEFDRAFAWLRHAIGAGVVNYPFLMIDPLLERLRGDERFAPFAEEVRRAWEEFEV